MQSSFFFYDKLRNDDLLKEIDPIYVKKKGYVKIKSMQDFRIDHPDNNIEIHGFLVKFPLSFKQCIEKISSLNLGEKNRSYKCEQAKITLCESGTIETAHLIYLLQ